jgi:hypothetical protein
MLGALYLRENCFYFLRFSLYGYHLEVTGAIDPPLARPEIRSGERECILTADALQDDRLALEVVVAGDVPAHIAA